MINPTFTHFHVIITGAEALSSATFGEGVGDIYLDDVQCSGSENRLIDCPYNPIDNCVHAEDAGVRCQGCATGELRLVDGLVPNEGRVELCVDNVWGTVCDDFWGQTDATVVCRQLGYSIFGSQALSNAPFGAGTGDIQLDDVSCTGAEDRLIDCGNNGIGMHNCQHFEDAGVRCVQARMSFYSIVR